MASPVPQLSSFPWPLPPGMIFLGMCFLLACTRQETAQASLVARALPLYMQAASRGLSPPSEATRRVSKLLSQGELQQARQQARQALEAIPKSGEAAFTYGVVLNTSASFGSARLIFEQALENGPSCTGSEHVFYYYGLCLLRLGEAQAAREALLAQLKILPQDGNTRNALGELELQEGNPVQARALFEKALQLFADSSQSNLTNAKASALAHLGVSDTFLQEGHLDLALEAVQRSIALNPNAAEAWYKLSRIQLQLGNSKEAGQAFQRFARLGAGH